MDLKEFNRFVEDMEESAIQLFIVSFSASRLNGLPLFLPFLSFFDLASVLEAAEEPKNEVRGGDGFLLDWP